MFELTCMKKELSFGQLTSRLLKSSFHISEEPEGLPQAVRPRAAVRAEPRLRLELRVGPGRRLLRRTGAQFNRILKYSTLNPN